MSKTILRVLEYHGRLLRPDGSPVPAGRHAVRFSLHSDARGQRTSWVELHGDVEVGTGGHISVVLGREHPFEPKLFDNRTRWISARVVRSGETDAEVFPRQEVHGVTLQASKLVERHETRLETLEENQRTLRAGPSKEKLRTQIASLAERLETVEVGELNRLSRDIDSLLDRLDRLDGDDARLDRVEERLGDVDGPDGDIIDMNDRMDSIEKRAVRVLEHLEVGPDRQDRLLKRMTKLETAVAKVPAIDMSGEPEAMHLPIEGGALTGPLTIEKGGLEVASGDLVAKQLKVFSVSASQAVRAARIVAEEQLEIRGDLTADNTKRAIQVRKVEGRNGSSKKDGPLHLNSRGGFEVTVGNKASKKGLTVHGEVRTTGKDLAERFVGATIDPGLLVRMDGGRRVVLSDQAYDTRVVGIVSTSPGVSLGHDGQVPVALRGTAPCRVVGPVRIGDLLVPSDVPGHAMAASPDRTVGCLVGKAMEDLDGSGEILVLVL